MKGGLIFSFLIVLPSIFLTVNGLGFTSGTPTPSEDGEGDMYIVYLSEQPPQGTDIKTYCIKILSAVLGSEEAAKDALGYTYTIMNGFSATLKPDQVELLKKQPGVGQVVKDRTYKLID